MLPTARARERRGAILLSYEKVMRKVRVQAMIVGTGGQVFIRLGTPNERDGQRDRGPDEGTMVRVA